MKLMGMACETNSSTAVHRVCKEPDMSLTNLFALSGHLTYKDRVLRLLIDDSAGGIKKLLETPTPPLTSHTSELK